MPDLAASVLAFAPWAPAQRQCLALTGTGGGTKQKAMSFATVVDLIALAIGVVLLLAMPDSAARINSWRGPRAPFADFAPFDGLESLFDQPVGLGRSGDVHR